MSWQWNGCIFSFFILMGKHEIDGLKYYGYENPFCRKAILLCRNSAVCLHLWHAIALSKYCFWVQLHPAKSLYSQIGVKRFVVSTTHPFEVCFSGKTKMQTQPSDFFYHWAVYIPHNDAFTRYFYPSKSSYHVTFILLQVFLWQRSLLLQLGSIINTKAK